MAARPTIFKWRQTEPVLMAMNIIRNGQVRWLSGSGIRRQNQFINELFEVAALVSRGTRLLCELLFRSETCNTAFQLNLIDKCELARLLRGRYYRERVPGLVPSQLSVAAKHPDATNLASLERSVRTQGFRREPWTRPAQGDGVERVALSRITNVLPSKRLALVVGEASCQHLRGPFTIDLEGAVAVDCFAVHREPAPDGQQDVLCLYGNRAVRPGSDVQQQGAVLADDVDQISDQ